MGFNSGFKGLSGTITRKTSSCIRVNAVSRKHNDLSSNSHSTVTKCVPHYLQTSRTTKAGCKVLIMGFDPQAYLATWYYQTTDTSLDDWLTVHHSITLVNFQLDVQNSYLFIYNTFIKILFMFRALPCSSSGGLRRNCLCAASGIVTLCRWLSCAPVKKELLKMSREMLETCWGF